MAARYKSIFRNDVALGLVLLLILAIAIMQGCKSQTISSSVKKIDAMPVAQNAPDDGQPSRQDNGGGTAASASSGSSNDASSTSPAAKAQSGPEAQEDTPILSADLSEIKDFAGGMGFIVGNKASAIDIITINNIKNSLYNKGIDTGRVILTSELSDYKDKRYFVIGSPCDNPVAAELFKAEIAKKGDCNIFQTTEGIIRLIPTKNTNFVMYIGANMAENTRKAGVVVQDYDKYGLTGTDVQVLGTLASPQMVVVK